MYEPAAAAAGPQYAGHHNGAQRRYAAGDQRHSAGLVVHQAVMLAVTMLAGTSITMLVAIVLAATPWDVTLPPADPTPHRPPPLGRRQTLG